MIAIRAEWSGRFDRLFELLTLANREFNLTRIESREAFDIKHVADSLALLEYFPELPEEGLALADVGTGAGFPSLVLGIARPEWRICAIDSTAKKTAFVRHAAAELGLDNVETVTARARELNRKPEFQRRFDVVTARAVGPAADIVAETGRMLKPGGRCIFYKTPHSLGEELEALRRRFPAVSWRSCAPFQLPNNSGSRTFLFS